MNLTVKRLVCWSLSLGWLIFLCVALIVGSVEMVNRAVPAGKPSLSSGTVLMVDCEGRKRPLGRYVGEPDVSPSWSVWISDKNEVVKTRGFVLFVKDGKK